MLVAEKNFSFRERVEQMVDQENQVLAGEKENSVKLDFQVHKDKLVHPEIQDHQVQKEQEENKDKA